MAIYIVIASILLGCMLIMVWSSLENNARQQDSALKQRAIFNINEQRTYTRLKEILPGHMILAHVSPYDRSTGGRKVLTIRWGCGNLVFPKPESSDTGFRPSISTTNEHHH